MHKGSKLMVGLGTVALAAAATYFLTGQRGIKNRKRIKAWTREAKNDILEKLADLNEVSRRKYNEIVQEVGERYQETKKAAAPEVEAFVKELKAQWNDIVRRIAETE